MAIVEHEPTPVRTTEVDELELLWRAPAVERPPATKRDQRPLAQQLAAERTLAAGWFAFFVSLFFEPPPAPGVQTPGWAYALSASFLLMLVVAGVLARARARVPALGAANVAGVLGTVLATTCVTSGHHLGWWPVYELAATGALLGLGLSCLFTRATGRVGT
jgi:hypothetical protein